MDNSALAAEYGHVSGAIVNIVTRSGSDEFRGDVFEFLRNDAFDARNFFEFTSSDPHPFQRNQFGGSVGGPDPPRTAVLFHVLRRRPASAGRRREQPRPQRPERASATDPIIRQLIPLIPRANFFDADGTPRFVGSAPAVVDANRATLDLRFNLGKRDRLHAYHGRQQVEALEPGSQGNSIPGFGQASRPFTSMTTVTETHTFGSALLNEARFGRSRLRGGTFPAHELNPAEFGIGNGVTSAIGLPQMIVAGALNFGGPGTLPMGRYDTSYVFVDTFTRASGRHSITSAVRPTLHQPELCPGHWRLQLSERGGVSRRYGKCVQHHARRTAERHRSARGRPVLSGSHRCPRQAHARTRLALRVARHADRAG